MRRLPTDLPGGCRLAVFADPVGAVFAVIASAPEAEARQPGLPGGLHWAEVLSRDVEAARAFYPAVLGWEPVTGPGGYTVFRRDGEPVAGLMAMPERVPEAAPSHWFVSFAVSDLDLALATVADLGGVVDQPPLDLPDGGRFAVVDDPQGAVFGLAALPGSGRSDAGGRRRPCLTIRSRRLRRTRPSSVPPAGRRRSSWHQRARRRGGARP